MLAWMDGWKIVVFGTAIAMAPSLLSHPAQAARPHERTPAAHGSPNHHVEASVHAASSNGASSVRVIYGGRGAAEARNTGKRGGAVAHEASFTRGIAFSRGASAGHGSSKYVFSKNGKARYATRGGYGYGGLQCVPFARAASGIELKGNANVWWYAAAGVYDRGSRPEPGSVLNFRSTGRMRLGHVAVVTQVVNAREIQIDHANWAGSYGSVARGVPVVDVSANNDWSEVRVGLGRGGDYGSVYPTYGFIYDRPDTGTMTARRDSPAQSDEEVAEAPERPRVITPTRRRHH